MFLWINNLLGRKVCRTASEFCGFLLFIFLQQWLEVDNGVNDLILDLM